MWLRMRCASQITLPPTAASSDSGRMRKVFQQPARDSFGSLFSFVRASATVAGDVG